MSYIEQDRVGIYTVDLYEKTLKKLYPERLLKKYANIINDEIKIVSDRKKYKQIIKVLVKMTECGYNIFYAQDAVFMDMKELAEKLKKIVGDMPVYITFDIDALDPSAAPGTGTPVIGGPSSAQVRKLLYNLKGINVVAADLVEVLPAYDHSEITSLAASNIAMDLM